MKKAKILLSAIVVLAITGGALAFTAKKTQTTLFTVHGVNNTCTTGAVYATVIAPPPGGSTISASTADRGTCTTFTISE